MALLYEFSAKDTRSEHCLQPAQLAVRGLMARVAFLLPDFAMGGAERVVLALIKSLLKDGIEIDLVLARREGELLPELPSEVNVISLGAKRLRGTLIPFIRYLRDRQPDVVHARMWPITLLSIVGRALARCASRVVIGDDSILSIAYGRRGPAYRLMLRATIALLYPRAEARIAVSRGAADDLAKLGGLDPNSITVLYNPVALPRPDQKFRDIDWDRNGARVLAVGNLIPVKNYPLLLAAFARLTRSRPASLVVLGEGPERSRLESLAASLGIGDRVTMPGATDDPASYYASADVLVLSSNNEGFGNVLVEAMSHGLTAVSTDCPTGPREILDGGRYGYLVPCDNATALAAGIADALDRPFASDVLRARAEELSGPHVIDEYLKILLPGFSR